MNPSMLKIAARVASPSPAEGALAAPDGQVIAALMELLQAKYAIEASYRSFADRTRGPWRDSLVEHWTTHAGEERQSAYDVAMKIVALGGDPALGQIVMPSCTASLEGFFVLLAEQEMAAILAARKIAAMAGDDMALRVMMENTSILDSQHLDDLRRMGSDVGVPF